VHDHLHLQHVPRWTGDANLRSCRRRAHHSGGLMPLYDRLGRSGQIAQSRDNSEFCRALRLVCLARLQVGGRTHSPQIFAPLLTR
jgi:hypothetical protein